MVSHFTEWVFKDSGAEKKVQNEKHYFKILAWSELYGKNMKPELKTSKQERHENRNGDSCKSFHGRTMKRVCRLRNIQHEKFDP